MNLYLHQGEPPLCFERAYGTEIPTLQIHWHEIESGTFTALPLPPPTPQKLLVIIHSFQVDRLDALLQKLRSLGPFQHLALTTCDQDNARTAERLIEQADLQVKKVTLDVMENRGRDLLPFWRVLKKAGSESDFFVKLHLKKSSHLNQFFPQADGRDASEAWMDDIVSSILPGEGESIQNLMGSMLDMGIGAVFPRPWPSLAYHGWGSTKELIHAKRLCLDLGINPYTLYAPLVFPVGNMFIGRTATFLKLADHFSQVSLYPEEPIGVSGTVLHAIERIYGFALHHQERSFAVLYPFNPRADHVDSAGSLGRKFILFPCESSLQKPHTQATEALHPADSMQFYQLTTELWEEKMSLTSEIAKMQAQLNSHRSSRVFKVMDMLKRAVTLPSF